jgi:hypothetical protein
VCVGTIKTIAAALMLPQLSSLPEVASLIAVASTKILWLEYTVLNTYRLYGVLKFEVYGCETP